MLFKKSFIPLSAALVLALNSDSNNLMNYIAACLFFTMGMRERMEEKAEDDRIREDEIIDEWEYEKEKEHKRQQKNKKKTTEED